MASFCCYSISGQFSKLKGEPIEVLSVEICRIHEGSHIFIDQSFIFPATSESKQFFKTGLGDYRGASKEKWEPIEVFPTRKSEIHKGFCFLSPSNFFPAPERGSFQNWMGPHRGAHREKAIKCTIHKGFPLL